MQTSEGVAPVSKLELNSPQFLIGEIVCFRQKGDEGDGQLGLGPEKFLL